MTVFLLFLHVLVCFTLIVVVLFQTGKGADIGASFGAGGSQTVFGGAGAGSFLGKLTAAAATIFMLTSLTLTYFVGRTDSTIMPAAVAPAQQQAPVMPSDLGSTPPAPIAEPGEAPPASAAPETEKQQ